MPGVCPEGRWSYEGILPVCESDDGLAVVMGHEIAHAIARHGNERMSQQMLIQAGSTAAAYALKRKIGVDSGTLGDCYRFRG